MDGPSQSDGSRLLDIYDGAVGPVYSYLAARCGSPGTAEELTAETFLAAAAAERSGGGSAIDMAWLIGVARHKLVDHWRRQEREQRRIDAVRALAVEAEDHWDAQLDSLRARQVLGALQPAHRAVLSLRYLDDLPVPEIAGLVGRSVHATEGLLVRARAAFRRAYQAGPGCEKGSAGDE